MMLCMVPKKGEDGGSHGVNGGGAARGAVDGALCTCCVCSRSFHGLEALQLHMKICPPAPAATTQPPALFPLLERKARAAHVPTVLEVVRLLFGQWVREDDLGMPYFAKIVRAAQETVAYAASLANLASIGRGGAGAGAGVGVIKSGYACKVCVKMFKSGQVLGGHMTAHRRARLSLACNDPAPAASISGSPPGFAMRKQPAMEEAAARGNGKRRCIRLFGVDILVEAPKK